VLANARTVQSFGAEEKESFGIAVMLKSGFCTPAGARQRAHSPELRRRGEDRSCPVSKAVHAISGYAPYFRLCTLSPQVLANARTVQSFGAEEKEASRYREALDKTLNIEGEYRVFTGYEDPPPLAPRCESQILRRKRRPGTARRSTRRSISRASTASSQVVTPAHYTAYPALYITNPHIRNLVKP